MVGGEKKGLKKGLLALNGGLFFLFLVVLKALDGYFGIFIEVKPSRSSLGWSCPKMLQDWF